MHSLRVMRSPGNSGSSLGTKSVSLMIVFKVSADCNAMTFYVPVKLKLWIKKFMDCTNLSLSFLKIMSA